MKRNQGFTLIEIAIVLMVIGFLFSKLTSPMSESRLVSLEKETIRSLGDARDALTGFVVLNGRLPCPAVAQNSDESPVGGGACAAQSGFLPVSLGVKLNDGFGRPIRYAVETQAWDRALVVPPPVGSIIPNSVTTDRQIRAVPLSHENMRTNLGACSSKYSRYSRVISGQALACGVTENLASDNLGAVVWSDGSDDSTENDNLVDWPSWQSIVLMVSKRPI